MLYAAPHELNEAFRSRDFSSHEISAVSCVPPNPTKKWTTYVLVGFWESHHIEVLLLTSADSYLTTLCKTSPLPSLPRSVLLYNFGGDGEGDDHLSLLAGLSDGSLACFLFKDNDLSIQKIISFGDAPVTLTACEVEDKRAVFACGSKAVMLFWDKERFHHSPVLLKVGNHGFSSLSLTDTLLGRHFVLTPQHS